jgi:hypothetical protein
VLQVKKGSTIKVHSHTLLKARVATLQAANNAASKRKKRKRKQIQLGRTLSQQEAEEIIERRDAEALVKAERREERVQTGSSGEGSQRCGRCSKTGHNKRTCKKDAARLGN